MKTLLTLLFAVTLSVSTLTQAQTSSNSEILIDRKIDTAFVNQKADSLASLILKEYDENSLRRSGVPIHVSHFDKVLTSIEMNKMVVVAYHFNQQKFYGENWTSIEILNSNEFPYSFNLVYDLVSQKTSVKENQVSNTTITEDPAIDTINNHLIYQGKYVEMYVEKAIYNLISKNNFLMKFSIINTSDKTIGLELSDYWNIVYPNQWGIYTKPYREVVNESQIIPDNKIDKAKLSEKYNNNMLVMIKPGETLEYYRDWNGSGEKVEVNQEEYFILTFDGQLIFTNGEEIEHLTLDKAKEANRVVVISYPINYKVVPENAFVIEYK